MTALIIFVSAFGIVFALGLQSLAVNNGHRWHAFVNSLVIGSFNLALLKFVPQATDGVQIAAYLLGGPFGIIAAMATHPRLVRFFARRRDPSKTGV